MPGQMMCSVEGCQKPVHCRGWCHKHYTRWRRHGTPQGVTREDRLWAKVVKTPTCWRWTGTRNQFGYGRIRIEGKQTVVHRVVYELLVGPIPEGMTLDHVKERGCRYRDCCNPDHLEPVTLRENILRGDSPQARNATKTHCEHGHPFDEANTYHPPNGGRSCRACTNASIKLYKERRREASRGY